MESASPVDEETNLEIADEKPVEEESSPDEAEEEITSEESELEAVVEDEMEGTTVDGSEDKEEPAE